MSKKLYFQNEDSEFCHTKRYFLEQMAEDGLNQITVFEAIKEKMTEEFFWCKLDECFYDKDSCGKHCAGYAPCNGKSGKCRHYSLNSYMKGKQVIIKKQEKKNEM